MAPRFHRLTIGDLRRETAGAVSIAFDVPADLAQAYAFQPGQYLTLKAVIDGAEIRRSYSICSGPADGELRIGVKRVEGGVFSPWAAEHLKPGDRVEAMTPVGRFGAGALAPGARTTLGIAAGSGITPLLSIMKAVLGASPDHRFILVYGNRSTAEIMFRSTLEALKDRYLSRLSVFHVLSREDQDLAILNGRLNGPKLKTLLPALLPVAAIDQALICGPAAMNAQAELSLRELGVPEQAIQVERFVSEAGGAPRQRPATTAPMDAAAFAVAITADGKTRTVAVGPDQTILDAALSAGLDLPYACKGGMCTTCRAKSAGGPVTMERNYSLEPWELQAGFVLTCQAHPHGNGVRIDFDAV